MDKTGIIKDSISYMEKIKARYKSFDKRIRESLDCNWCFKLGDYPEARKKEFDDSLWRELDLPHDWSIEGEYKEKHATGNRGGFLPSGIGWYRKTFNVPENWSKRKVFIEFDGIYMNSDVWINGHHLGHRPYGYIGLSYDLSSYLREGRNVISVRVDTEKAPSGRWYTGSGIYRHTWLTVTDQIYISHWGTYVTTPEINDERAKVCIKTELKNDSNLEQKITLISKIEDERGKCIQEIQSEHQISCGDKKEIFQETDIQNPKLWSTDKPQLYILKTYVKKDKVLIDDYISTFGIRYFEFDSNTGFSLNGKSMKFKGVCHHHDAGPVGAAVPDKVLERRLKILKEMGCNAIRTSHNPMSPEFYDLCDYMGFMLMDEVFDGWEKAKAKFDYGLYFEDWWQKDLGDFLRRDRNHPSIIIWSIGNEVYDINVETTKKLVSFVHKNEPTRPVSCGVDRIDENADINRQQLDIAGYNGGGGACFILEKDHHKYPNRRFIKTEVPHSFQTRGYYRTKTWWRDQGNERIEIPDLSREEIFSDGSDDFYNSSYDNSGVRISARDSWEQTMKFPWLTGEFRWTGFDYLGEATGWPARMRNFGIIDLCGFPKDHYYFYQSQWTGKPMVHILPHWTHPGMEGTIIPVWIYSNCDSVELFLNEKSLGIKKTKDRMNLSWDIPYEAGQLKAVAYRNGEIAASKEVQTSGSPAAIKLDTDNNSLQADGRDISHVSFTITDSKGLFVPYAMNRVDFKVTGPVNNLGFENGDPLDLTPHYELYRKAFYGMGLGIFQSTLKSGNIEVIAAAILADKEFVDSTMVSIDLSKISLRGESKSDFEIYYTEDGTKADRHSKKYKESFEINDSCKIRALIIKNNLDFMEIESEFRKIDS